MFLGEIQNNKIEFQSQLLKHLNFLRLFLLEDHLNWKLS